ncbi:Leucine--tRNA ligase [compost metagenome]
MQINGKRRAEITVSKGMAASAVEALVLALEAVQKALDGKAPKKVVVVQDRIVNLVV